MYIVYILKKLHLVEKWFFCILENTVFFWKHLETLENENLAIWPTSLIWTINLKHKELEMSHSANRIEMLFTKQIDSFWKICLNSGLNFFMKDDWSTFWNFYQRLKSQMWNPHWFLASQSWQYFWRILIIWTFCRPTNFTDHTRKTPFLISKYNSILTLHIHKFEDISLKT